LFQGGDALPLSRPDFMHPRRRTLCEFGVILLLPGSLGGAKRIALLLDFDFAPGYFGKERAAPTLTDKLVDVGNDIYWEDDVCPLG
jgi:hypothetical protein